MQILWPHPYRSYTVSCEWDQGICISNKQPTLATDIDQTIQHIEKNWHKALKLNPLLINNDFLESLPFIFLKNL